MSRLRSNRPTPARKFALIALFAVLVLAAQAHNHNLLPDGVGRDNLARSSVPCTACLLNASPLLIPDAPSIVPTFDSIALDAAILPFASASETPAPCGRAPPAA